MKRREFLSITALPLLAGTGVFASTPVVALPAHLADSSSLTKKFLEESRRSGFLKSSSPVFYYYRLSELELVMHAFSLGLVEEVWTTPALLTHYRDKFRFTAAVGVGDLHLEKISKGLRSTLSAKMSIGYFSLPETQFYFAETCQRDPKYVNCLRLFRQDLFGPLEDRDLAIYDSLPLTLIKKNPNLRDAKLHLDTFSHPVHLGMIIRKDEQQRDIVSGVRPLKYQPEVPKYLSHVFEAFQNNATAVVQKFWAQEQGSHRLILG